MTNEVASMKAKYKQKESALLLKFLLWPLFYFVSARFRGTGKKGFK